MPALTRKNLWLLAIAALVFTALALGILFLNPDTIKNLVALKDAIVATCRAYPTALFAALVILPAFGFPVSALLILAGAIWGSTWQSCALGILAMSLNMTWTYFAAAGPARHLVARILGSRWDRWKNMKNDDLIRLTILLRVTPGVPLFLQNYVLGLLAVPYIPYILLSIPLNGIFVVGFVLTGGAIFEGRVGLAFAGIGVLVAAVLLVHILQTKLKVASN